MIVRNEIPPKPDWDWVFIWNRQIGNYKVRFEWLKRKYTEKGGLNYAVEWRTKNDQVLYTYCGQREPEW